MARVFTPSLIGRAWVGLFLLLFLVACAGSKLASSSGRGGEVVGVGGKAFRAYSLWYDTREARLPEDGYRA